MGVQSLEERLLTSVHRKHGETHVLDACRMILEGDFILNIDLMYGLPGQTEDDFARDLASAAREGVPSLTLYNLRVNEQTPVIHAIKEEERLDDLRRLARWRSFAARTATGFGYTQTRWHTFKRLDGPASRHERLPCFESDKMEGFQFGAGMSARSHLGRAIYRNHRDFNTYLERIESGVSPVEETIPMRIDDLKAQFVARSLGDGKSLAKAQYRQAFGVSVTNDYGDLLGRLGAAGLVEESDEAVALSESGKLIYDLITIAFYPEWARKWLKEREGLPLGKRQKLAP
jgi:oxygen-independent coproporphyrinogen-3 oxidase